MGLQEVTAVGDRSRGGETATSTVIWDGDDADVFDEVLKEWESYPTRQVSLRISTKMAT